VTPVSAAQAVRAEEWIPVGAATARRRTSLHESKAAPATLGLLDLIKELLHDAIRIVKCPPWRAPQSIQISDTWCTQCTSTAVERERRPDCGTTPPARLAAPRCDLTVLAPVIARNLCHAAIICRGTPSGK
jgi:hypothetical protein